MSISHTRWPEAVYHEDQDISKIGQTAVALRLLACPLPQVVFVLGSEDGRLTQRPRSGSRQLSQQFGTEGMEGSMSEDPAEASHQPGL
jgi:hypothetical protein